MAVTMNRKVDGMMPAMSNVTGTIRPACARFLNVKNGEESTPVEVQKVSVLGTRSDYNKGLFEDKNNEKNEKTIMENPNLQENIEVAFLEPDADTFCVNGSVGVISRCLDFETYRSHGKAPDIDLNERVPAFMHKFKENGGFHCLAERYAKQLLNGAILFRGRYAKDLTASMKYDDGKSLEVKCASDFMQQSEFKEFVGRFADALGNSDRPLFIEYSISGVINPGGEIYPSEELDRNKGKTLFKVKTGGISNAAGLHPQKVGNAIRTIDDWYSDEQCRPIPVDPYGPDKKNSTARRKPNSGLSFFDMLAHVDQLEDSLDGGVISDDCMFFAAMMVRGGVFSRTSDK